MINPVFPPEEELCLIHENQKYLYMTPPYMPFDEQDAVVLRLNEAFVQHEFLLVHGYSGCGKTRTVVGRFAPDYPETVLVFDFFGYSTGTSLVVEIGDRFGMKLKQRATEINVLCERLKAHPYIMMIFDEVNATRITKRNLLEKLEILRRIYMSCDVSIVICGNSTISNELFNPMNADEYSSILSRLDDRKMTGMRSIDAEQYFSMLANIENARFTHDAKEALIKIATNPSASGIKGFVTIISRCITLSRVLYYKKKNINVNETTRVDDNAKRPVGNTIITLPATPEMLTIDEGMVYNHMSHKSTFYKNLPDKKKQ
ncbi:hypothetical protein AGMMS49992_31860 [Clostridia bacterium]|nr:hypothetical protein AGMMS49992_31860 [Clostridia bacterium]